MTDVEKIILDKLDKLDDNIVKLHEKIDTVKDDHQEQITDNAKDIVSFKAKWGIIGFILIAIGNFIKPVFELIKNKLGA